MHGGLVTKRGLLKSVVEAFALHDREGVAEAFVVGAEPEEPTDDRLIGAVALPGAGEGAVELDERLLRGAGHQVAGDPPEATRAGRVAGGGAHHHGADDIEEGDHGRGPAQGRSRMRRR